jgi:hypothetical protein
LDDDYPDNSNNHSNRNLSHNQSKYNEISSGKGFVLLANDDPELTDDYVSPNKNNSLQSQSSTISTDSDGQTKRTHYLKRQNTLLKEWEVIKTFLLNNQLQDVHMFKSFHIKNKGRMTFPC